jgi:hypothetical protein
MVLAVHGITRVGAVLVGQEASRVASHKWTITPVIVALVVLGGIRQMTYIGHQCSGERSTAPTRPG